MAADLLEVLRLMMELSQVFFLGPLRPIGGYGAGGVLKGFR
jgi:hypothetical protein